MRPSINTPPGGRSGSVVRKLLPRKRNQRVVDDQDRQGQGDDSQGFDLPGYLLVPGSGLDFVDFAVHDFSPFGLF